MRQPLVQMNYRAHRPKVAFASNFISPYFRFQFHSNCVSPASIIIQLTICFIAPMSSNAGQSGTNERKWGVSPPPDLEFHAWFNKVRIITIHTYTFSQVHFWMPIAWLRDWLWTKIDNASQIKPEHEGTYWNLAFSIGPFQPYWFDDFDDCQRRAFCHLL